MFIGIAIRLGGGNGGVRAPFGFILLTDADGALLRDSDGAYLMEAV